MTTLNQLNRFQACVGHLLISITIATLSALLVFGVWYPSPLAAATGVTDIFWMVLGVDVTLGPLLTLVVFNPAKKELKWDLTIIATVQLFALLYGLHTVFVARPVYEVFNKDRFDLVYANDFSEEKLAKVTDAAFKSLPLFGPKIIAARSPEDREARNKILFSALAGGDDLPQMPEYYLAYEQEKAQILQSIQPLEQLKTFNPDSKTLQSLLDTYAKWPTGVGYLPLRGKILDVTVLLRKDTGEVLEIVDLRPWKT